MTPYLVTPPASLPLTVSDAKADPALRITHSEEDAALERLISGFTAELDGWNGLLGRCIMPQVWAVDVTGPGPHVLPFPDASSITAQVDGDPAQVDVARMAIGHVVAVKDVAADAKVTISATYGLPAQDVPRAQTLIVLMLQRHYDNVTGPEFDARTSAINHGINSLRWRRV